jgi:hypothetical protein
VDAGNRHLRRLNLRHAARQQKYCANRSSPLLICLALLALVIVSGLFTRLLISIFLMPALYAIVARDTDRIQV